jgi:DNA-binding NarL/FixJ family response regulator
MFNQLSGVAPALVGRRSLLLVEDEQDTRSILARRMDAFGWTCHAHASVESALRDPALFHADAVVTDLVLGDGNAISGIELIPMLRTLGVRTPVVLVTAFADAPRIKAALNAGAARLLEKPFSTEALRQVIDEVAAVDTGLERIVSQRLSRARLTGKEEEVARAALKGLSSGEIGSILGNSEKTVKAHLTRVYQKLGVTGRLDLFHLMFPF